MFYLYLFYLFLIREMRGGLLLYLIFSSSCCCCCFQSSSSLYTLFFLFYYLVRVFFFFIFASCRVHSLKIHKSTNFWNLKKKREKIKELHMATLVVCAHHLLLPFLVIFFYIIMGLIMWTFTPGGLQKFNNHHYLVKIKYSQTCSTHTHKIDS